MDSNGQVRTCSTCRKEIAVDNFALHETHCRRFLSPCPDCDETVPTEHLEQHRLDEHTQVNCPKCSQKMERRLLLDHKLLECVERLQSCEFCELELPWREMEEHELVCGSRTKSCRACRRYVMMRDQAAHAQTCPYSAATTAGAVGVPPPRPLPRTTITPDRSKVICIGCMAFFPAGEIQKHKLDCLLAWTRVSGEEEGEEGDDKVEEEGAGALRLSSSLKNLSQDGPTRRELWDEGGDPDQVSPCAYCRLALPEITLRWHEPKCKIHVSLQ